jgi:glutamyl-tRNA(Gln) amidotransferase subunit E
MQELDYSKLGLKCGIEIHQQLDTHKLFCNCPSVVRENEPHNTTTRKIRAVAGELGGVDPAALHELMRNQEFIYESYEDTNCLVELDEEPPHPLNKEALEIVIEAAMLLKAKIVDELQIMRKTVIDGSNTSGFQRTVLVAYDGELNVDGRRIGIPTICLEEDAARIIKKEGNKTWYRLDRLGIPLAEIATDPDIRTPEEARKVAEGLGMMLRATGKVKRGLGTIRQDLNVSIKGGERIEIKGVQQLNDIPKLVHNEVLRQLNLIEIKNELKKRSVKDMPYELKDVSPTLKGSKSNVVKSAPGVFAVKLTGFNGLVGKELMPDYRFGTELAGIIKVIAGLKGLFHSDELPAYGITEKEVQGLKKALKVSEKDAFVLVACDKQKAEKALRAVVDRCNVAITGVPKETRKAEVERTVFMRPLPGSARMYPETDEPVIKIAEKTLDEIRKSLPLTPEKEGDNLRAMGLGDELVNQLIRSPHLRGFKRLSKELNLKPSLIASTLLSAPDNVALDGIKDALSMVAEKRIAKESIADLLDGIAKSGKSAEEMARTKNMFLLSESELEKRIADILARNKELADKKQMGPLIGRVMTELRGAADVEDVKRILSEKL